MKKILITGGAGFIGSHLADRLLKENCKIVVIDNLSVGKPENIHHNLQNPDFKFYEQDLLNFDEIDRIFSHEKFETIFHFAANSDIKTSYYNPDIDFKDTFLLTYNILNLMKKHKVKNIIFPSSSAIYGKYKDAIDEDSGPLFPESHYGAAKLASEGFISSFAKNYGFKAWIIRFPNVVGERATHGVVLDFVNQLATNKDTLNVLGNGNQEKPYLYVHELIDAIYFLWKTCGNHLNYVNLSGNSTIKVKEIAEIVAKEMLLNPEINYQDKETGWVGDVPAFKYKPDKIRGLGWETKINSSEAIKKSVIEILKGRKQ